MVRYIELLAVVLILAACSMEMERSANAGWGRPIICYTAPGIACKKREGNCTTACLSDNPDFECSCEDKPGTNDCYCEATVAGTTVGGPSGPGGGE